MTKLIIGLAALAGTLCAADIKSEFAKHWTTMKELTVEVANAMPQDGYSFRADEKVQPVEMTFGELMNHIGQSTFGGCSAIAGSTAPAKPSPTDKAAVVKYIGDAFDLCSTSLDKEDANLDRMVKRGKTESSVREVMLGYFIHTAHHRGQAEVYLRLKGVKPPTYKQ